MMAFRDVVLGDKDEVEQVIRYVSDGEVTLAFSNILSWTKQGRYQICREEGFTVLRYIYEGNRDQCYYLYPYGQGDPSSLLKRLALETEAAGMSLRFFLFSLRFLDTLKALFPGYGLHFLESDSCYFYLREDLAALRGRKYQNKRNLVHQFKEKYDWSISPMSRPDFEECLGLYSLWYTRNQRRNSSDTDYESYLQCESAAIRLILENFEALGQQGIVVRVAGKVVAFAYGVPLSDEVFDVQLEKADEDYKGAYAFVNQQFALNLPANFTYLNREEDMGLEGLRKAKLQYHPKSIVPIYRFERIPTDK